MKRIIKKSNLLTIVAAIALAVCGTIVATASGGGNALQRETYFICPSVSTHNTHGMWVIGAHGGYYVLIPSKGGINDGSKVFLTIPVQVPSLAQIPAGWALYNSLPSYPNLEGMVVLLQEGIDTWLGSPAGWQEGDMASVINNGDGTYTVMNLTQPDAILIDHSIPLASAAVW